MNTYHDPVMNLSFLTALRLSKHRAWSDTAYSLGSFIVIVNLKLTPLLSVLHAQFLSYLKMAHNIGAIHQPHQFP